MLIGLFLLQLYIMDRRTFVKKAVVSSVVSMTPSLLVSSNNEIIVGKNSNNHKISLSQWAYHRDIFGGTFSNYNWFKKTLQTEPLKVLQGDLDPTDIVVKANELNLKGVDLVTSMISAHKHDNIWLNDFRDKATDNDVSFVCLMTDTFNRIGDSNEEKRKLSVDDHKKWIDAAAELKCEHVRVNSYGDGSYLQVLNQCSKSVKELSVYAKSLGMKLTIENHGHPSSNGAWTDMLVESVDDDNFGVFLDFGNFFMGGFNVRPRRYYDTTQGVIDIAPHVTGISAKTRGFTEEGEDVMINYKECLAEVNKYDFDGWYSLEYEGDELSCDEGAIKTLELLEKYL